MGKHETNFYCLVVLCTCLGQRRRPFFLDTSAIHHPRSFCCPPNVWGVHLNQPKSVLDLLTPSVLGMQLDKGSTEMFDRLVQRLWLLDTNQGVQNVARGQSKLTRKLRQGSLHYTPEHCLVNGGFPLFWWNKNMFQLGKMFLLRSPVRRGPLSS